MPVSSVHGEGTVRARSRRRSRSQPTPCKSLKELARQRGESPFRVCHPVPVFFLSFLICFSYIFNIFVAGSINRDERFANFVIGGMMLPAQKPHNIY